MQGGATLTASRRRRCLWRIASLLTLVAAAPLRAEYVVERWSLDDGLPSNEVEALLREPGGFLWLATAAGLVRFDGRQFEVHDSRDVLDSRRLRALQRSGDGLLWVLSAQHRLARFDGRSFTAVEPWGSPAAGVRVIGVDAAQRLWVGGGAGLARWNGNAFTSVPSAGHGVRVLAPAADGSLWVGRSDGQVLQLRDDHVVATHAAAPAADSSPVLDVLPLGPDAALVLTRAGVSRLGAAGTTSSPPDADGCHALDEPTLQACVAGARLRLRPRLDDAAVRPASTLPSWRDDGHVLWHGAAHAYASECALRQLAVDDDGSVWVASACEGLLRLRRRSVEVLAAGFAGVEALAQTPDGALWLVAGDELRRWQDGRGETRVAFAPGGPRRLLYVDHDGQLWQAQHGVCRVDGDACTPAADWPRDVRAATITLLQQTRDGRWWVGGDRGLWRRDTDGQWHREPQPAAEFPAALPRALAEDAHGGLFLATAGAGLRHRDANGRWRAWTRADGLSSDQLRDVHVDAAGRAWVATEEHGLCRVDDVDAVRAACVGEADGLSSASLLRVLGDDHGRLWLASARGVSRLDVAALDALLDGAATRLHPRVYGRRDGLQARSGHAPAAGVGLRLRDGRLALPTRAGIALFDPRASAPPTSPPRVLLQQLELADGRRLEPAASIELPLGARYLALQFSALAATLTDPLYVRWRLLPESPQWRDASGATLRLPPLAAGSHRLELAALDAASGIQGPATELALQVPAWPWEQRPLLLAATLLLLASVGAWMLRHAAAVRRRARELERHVAARTADLSEQQARTEAALHTVEQQRSEIEQLAARRAQFFASVSHELRTPLSLLAGPLQDAVRGTTITPPQAEMMLRNARRLERLVAQLLDLERIDVGRFPLRPERRDLDALMREAAEAFAPIARQHELALAVEGAAEPCVCEVDADQIARVFGNLLSNALKFTPRGGRIVLRLRGDRDGARVEVDDSGPGVPEAWRERIFDRFSQVGGDATRSREGAGLGLALCREIAALHGGRLWVEARPGGGSRFVLALPAASQPLALPAPPRRRIEDADPAAGARPSPLPPPSSTRRTVLVAEDHPDLRVYLDGILCRDYDVLLAEDGEQALELARQQLPDLIVSDVTMPRRDGFALVRALRADEATAGIPLIFLTARASEADEIAALISGADQYLRKPFDAEVLRAHAAAALHMVERLKRRLARQAPPDDGAAALPADAATAAFVQQAEAWLAAHLHDEATSPDALAEALHMSRATLGRRFQAAFGEAPAARLRRLRLERARGLLARGEGNVSEAAYAVGYASLAVFSRAYREHFGVAPSRSAQESPA